MIKPLSAILFGMTAGFLSLIPLQAVTNHYAYNKCQALPETHSLIQVRAFAGTAEYCVSKAYL